jgi:molybdopterin adenylyltransferase
VKVAVLTVSDRVSRGEAEDGSGALLESLLREDGFEVERRLVADERADISAALRELADGSQIILTTGGTGLAPRDVTPEATQDVLEREAPARSRSAAEMSARSSATRRRSTSNPSSRSRLSSRSPLPSSASPRDTRSDTVSTATFTPAPSSSRVGAPRRS